MEIGDEVIKGGGIYRIIDRCHEVAGDGQDRDYLVLEEMYAHGISKCKIHVPVSEADNMLIAIPKPREFESIIKKAIDLPRMAWIDDRNHRIEAARSVVNSGDLTRIIKLSEAYRARRDSGKKGISSIDRELEERGVGVVTNAAAISFGCSPDEASGILEGMLARA